MLKRTITTLFSVASILLLTGQASSQDDASRRANAAAGDPAVEGTSNLDEIPAEDMPAVRQAVEEEAAHRDRIARIHRLRELAQTSNNRERLAKLDDLEQRELSHREAHRIRVRQSMSDKSWQDTENALGRGGIIRMRKANQDAHKDANKAVRERNANQDAKNKDARERAANAPKSNTSRAPSRAPSGRSPR